MPKEKESRRPRQNAAASGAARPRPREQAGRGWAEGQEPHGDYDDVVEQSFPASDPPPPKG
ncbi:MAG TPA: hypothetical protein VKZ69_00965 [Limnochordales bacterium]|nr:hypothetical protein [Limnochordales bacterium]